MSPKNFLYWSYWFSQPYIARDWVFYVWLGWFSAFFLAGIVLFVVRYYEKDSLKKEVYKRYGTIGLVMGFLGLVWFFFRQERIPFFAWRFWLLPWAPLLAWWVYKVTRFATKRVPIIRAQQQQKSIKDKYLPKRA
jgi:amino acid transporter